LLQTKERGIERPLFDEERALRHLLNPQQDTVPVQGTQRYGFQNEDVECPGQQVGVRWHGYS
jgi:hypothetical protein